MTEAISYFELEPTLTECDESSQKRDEQLLLQLEYTKRLFALGLLMIFAAGFFGYFGYGVNLKVEDVLNKVTGDVSAQVCQLNDIPKERCGLIFPDPFPRDHH